MPSASNDDFTILLSFFLMNPLSMCRAMTLSEPRAAFSKAVHTVLSTPPLTKDCGEEGGRVRGDGGDGGREGGRVRGDGGKEGEEGRKEGGDIQWNLQYWTLREEDSLSRKDPPRRGQPL